MVLDLFHPLVRRWFSERFSEPTAPQAAGWRHIAAGIDTLIAAPTGSGKTLAAFLWAINRLVKAGMGAPSAAPLPNQTVVVYVSPLKALANDIEKNLQLPLTDLRRLAADTALEFPDLRVLVRSGDTPARARRDMTRHPPHILITTPESLYLLLTADSGQRMLASAETVIVDEIHALAGDKRGAHLALSLERLDALAGRRLQRIGLSATQKPITEIARLLVGTAHVHEDGTPRCAIVDVGHRRTIDLSIEVTDQPMGPIATHELYADIYDRIATHVRAHRTTIVFVNTRRLVERVAHQLERRLGEGKVAAHHGSLSRRTRLQAEEGLKCGAIPVVVATASLELGIDVGHVDLVCHVGAPRALSTLLQRVGRSGHWLGAIPKGILFPLTRDELVQCAAAVRAVRAGELDHIVVPDRPLDVLAQQIVATVATGEIGEEDMWRLVGRAYPFRHLGRDDFNAVLEMLSEGVATRRGRRSAHVHRDRVHGRLRPRRGARLAAITGGGAIPDTADYDVIEDPAGTFVGRVNEDFAIESMAGDIFLLGNRSWRIRRVEAGRVRVEDAQGAPPTIPFWVGEAPARTAELSAAVGEVREQVAARLGDGTATAWLISMCGLDLAGAGQVAAYIAETLAVLGTVPTQRTVVAERFFDESGGMQLVVHAPFGGRINRAWGLALRKRFCRTFDFELQAAATDDGIVLSLGEQHSFPLDSVFGTVRSALLEHDLIQAVLAAPMFGTRWRWNATRALALPRHTGGRRVPMPIQRMRAEDLLAAVFPAQLACGDNRPGGPIEPPDHPLVNETLANCLHEALDVDGLRAVIREIEAGTLRTRAIDTAAPSPMSHEILNANPYAFLDDAPLEERRARAVALRRIDPELAGGIGALDPAAVGAVRAQAWPDVRDADELHDLLLSLVLLPTALLDQSRSAAARLPTRRPPPPQDGLRGEVASLSAFTPGETGEPSAWALLAAQLLGDRRAAVARWGAGAALVAAERVHLARAVLPSAEIIPPLHALAVDPVSPDEALRRTVQGWMECLGPVTVSALASSLGLPESHVETALLRLESEGVVLRGIFTEVHSQPAPVELQRPHSGGSTVNPRLSPIEWCDRRLLARIHRLTIGRLRREIESVSPADFIRFLLRWQHVHPGTQLHGRDGIVEVIGQLQGLELPAPAWERDVLSCRIDLYNPADLEQLCLGGAVAWGRLRLAKAIDESGTPVRGRRQAAPSRAAPLAFVLREALPTLLECAPPEADLLDDLSPAARSVFAFLQQHGAAFLADIARASGLLPSQTEDALWELVARGLVTGDGIAGLRTLLLPDVKRRPSHRRLRGMGGGAARRLMPVGRWALLRTGHASALPTGSPDPHADDVFARQLLRRYGVVLRELLAREVRTPAWRVLLSAYRRMEARGEIRGGRFVAGFVGEQFALPEAVDALRAVRRAHGEDGVVCVSAADPLNLVGILTPGARVSPFSNQVIAFRNGVPIEIGERGAVRSALQLGSGSS
ncbi:MAG: associated domain protein [Deltaproteobacteria bacterium]|nr:associated domain protein [Deltaproteobacteria bacterium]